MTNYPVTGVEGRQGWAFHTFNTNANVQTTGSVVPGSVVAFDIAATQSNSQQPNTTAADSPYATVIDTSVAGQATGIYGIIGGRSGIDSYNPDDEAPVTYFGDVLARVGAGINCGDALVAVGITQLLTAAGTGRIFGYALEDNATGSQALIAVRFCGWGFGPA